ncbi:MAG: quinolinate synthase NadA [Candidatus Lokiarchaeota archaeon]|nr:quinolinate synthase NadA [Candidatus Lokiarchaeota archaeon]
MFFNEDFIRGLILLNKDQKIKDLQEEILKLKDKEDFLILAHNYQSIEIQQISDYIADSLQLAKFAQKSSSKANLLFAAVYFMAEGGAIFNPDKNVYIANYEAICPMARMAPVSLIKEARENNPEMPIMMYINTTAEARAQADYICTSANCLKVAKKIGKKEIYFSPDQNLGYYIQNKTGIKVNILPENGCCIVHHKFDAKYIKKVKNEYPKAIILAHPECKPEVQELADFVGSTSQMEKHVIQSDEREFIIVTEQGLIDKLKSETEDKIFYKAGPNPICYNMKKNTLESIKHVMKNKPKEYIVTVSDEIIDKNKKLLEEMIKNS